MLEMLFVALPLMFTASVFSVAVIEKPDDVLVDDVEVPQVLQDSGYTPTTVAFMIRQTIHDITASAGSYQDARAINVSSQDLSPLAGVLDVLGIGRAVSVTQVYLGMVDSIVDIHIVEGDEDSLIVHTSVVDAGDFGIEKFRSFRGTKNDVEHLLRESARFIIEVVQPYIYAAHLFKLEANLDDQLLEGGGEEFPLTLDFIRSQLPQLDRKELSWFLNLLGLIELQQQRWERATEYFKRSLRANPDFVLARINWGWALSSRGEHRGAVRQFEMAEEINESLPVTHLYWAVALLRSGDLKGALRQLDKVDALVKNMADSYMIRAEILRRLPGQELQVARYERKAELARARQPRQTFFMPL